MIKTLVYTSEFIQNLTKYRNSLSQDLSQKSVEQQEEQKFDIKSNEQAKTELIGFESYDRKFKGFNENISVKIQGFKPIPQLTYDKIERSLYIKSDLSKDIANARRKIDEQARAREKMLEKEEKSINGLKEREEKLGSLIKSQDVRQQKRGVCDSERNLLAKCKAAGENCYDLEFKFKECLKEYN